MSRKTDKNLIVGLDIGTSKIATVVGELTPENTVEIVGVGSCPAKGLRKGVVVDIESTVLAIKHAVEEAELMAGCKINSVYTGITGSHIKSLNSHGIVAIRDSEVTDADIERVIDAAKAVAIPADQRILHIIPQEFVIDKQEGIREPVGMSGVRLESRIHMVTGAVSTAQNIVKCIRRCSLDVDDIILAQIASSYSCLTNDERELGVCMIDLGAGTTDIAIYAGGSIRHTHVIPIAGDQVTNDIAVALRTSTHNAEDIKIKYGSAMVKEENQHEVIEVSRIGERSVTKLSKMVLSEVIEPRFEELFNMIKEELRRNGLEEHLGSGIVLTGGSAKMDGVSELAESIFQMPVRIGLPHGVSTENELLNSSEFSTATGLLLYGKERVAESIMDSSRGGIREVVGQVKRWLQANF